jgi:hypothetical protein
MVLTSSIKALQRMKLAKPNVPKRQSIFILIKFRIHHVSERKAKSKTSQHQQLLFVVQATSKTAVYLT